MFDYIVDASGRAGILHTKYLKNRTYSKGLKNLAHWGYWTGTGSYGLGMERTYSPFFEALKASIGILMNQDISISRRQAAGKGDNCQSVRDFYLSSLSLAPNLFQLLEGSKLATDVKSATDYSYSSSSYAIPHARTVGDAGCFIDPFFSSGVHLALTGGVPAAATICAAIRGDCTEETAAKWYSAKAAEAYTNQPQSISTTCHCNQTFSTLFPRK
ncbi:hypothetical protein B0J14DRAFT_567223 [Halenospora varia]|nr:hypothetical protein B0J14DRAFT_567223 [Halenospora varia]